MIPESEKDTLIEAQKQVIGILFEVVKRLQSNIDLDQEYFELITHKEKNLQRLEKIIEERTENAKIVSRLLSQLET
jgi:anti-sigma-K factor RskA